MKRTNDIYIERPRLFEKCLNLCAVFADYAYIISPRFVCPWLLGVKCAELAEAVCREKHLVAAVIGHHDLRPVHHRRKNKRQRMLAK